MHKINIKLGLMVRNSDLQLLYGTIKIEFHGGVVNLTKDFMTRYDAVMFWLGMNKVHVSNQVIFLHLDTTVYNLYCQMYT